MDEIMKTDSVIIKQDTDDVEVVYGKVLNVRPNIPNIDYKGIVNKVCQYVNVADVLSKVKKGVEYVVEIPLEFQGGFESGEYWMMENAKTGKMWPSLMEIGADGRNKIVSPLSVRKKSFVEGNPTKDITNNYHNLYMQQQMNDLVGLVESTLQTVERIEHGQMDDRIALLEAGKQGFILALSQKDDDSRSTAMLNAINNITVAQNQIFETFKRRVCEFEALPKSLVVRFLREVSSPRSYLDKKDDEYDEISEYYGLYLQATRMLAGAYVMIGDVENAKRVFDMSIDKIKHLDYSKLKTIEFAHKDADFEKIYENASDFLIEEKRICLEDAKEYDCLSISISGDKLLEVFENEETVWK